MKQTKKCFSCRTSTILRYCSKEPFLNLVSVLVSDMLDKIFNWWFKKRLENSFQPSPSLFQEKDYKKLAEEALQKALDIMESDGWKKEKVDGKDVIYTKIIPTYGKVFKLVGILHISPEKIIDELYFKAEEMHKWNPTVKKVKVVQRISENVDIAHVIASEGAAGLVASRDFINLRIWKKQNSGYVHGTVGTTHPDVPVVTKYVRGEQGPGAYIITPTSTSENCELQWLLNTNLKGWIPQYLIDQTLSSVMIEYMQSLRKHCAKSCG